MGTATIGVIELPDFTLFDRDGTNWMPVNPQTTLVNKLILTPQIEAGGFEVELFNLKQGDFREAIGEVSWGGREFTKVYLGRRIEDIDPACCAAWGVTSNFTQQREIAGRVIRHLASRGKPVVVGGSDAIAAPAEYFTKGAAAVVLEKSGSANWAVLDYVLGRPQRGPLGGAMLPDGSRPAGAVRPMSPENWPLPSPTTIKQCLGRQYWSADYPDELKPIGAIVPDLGCDRKCDFCQTPTYALGYRYMSPYRVLEWAASLKAAGARSVLFASDQFLGRVLWRDGKEQILAILDGLRELGMAFSWPNGIELRKLTHGRGLNKSDTDLTPDLELVRAVYGWDGAVGCVSAYVPAERPINGRENYSKLLPWKEHVAILKEVVRAGVPALDYAVIIGFDDETHETLQRLEEALLTLQSELLAVNQGLSFHVTPYPIMPVPGTPQHVRLESLGLIRFPDPIFLGGRNTPCIDSRELSYTAISEWQMRLAGIGRPGHRYGTFYPQ